ncbi:MAG: ATP-binding protein, partial [Propionibacteriales bacterium]|nr:ATP-binding protein [Propionibacteriales bacterium]
MSDVVIVSGSPGSGKTTVARLLGQQFDRAVHLHTDDFFAAIVAGGVAPFLPQAQEQNQVVVGVTAEAAFGYATGGYTTIVDGVVGPWMI